MHRIMMPEAAPDDDGLHTIRDAVVQ